MFRLFLPIILALSVGFTAEAKPFRCAVTEVIKGDLLQCSNGRMIKAATYSAPATGTDAKCRAERLLGFTTKRLVEKLVLGKQVTIIPVPDSSGGLQVTERGEYVSMISIGAGRNLGPTLQQLRVVRPLALNGRYPHDDWCVIQF